jgi:lysozyme
VADNSDILAIAIPQLRRDEGVRNDAYLDTKGIPTIGVGHTGREVHLGLTWTDGQVNATLSVDLQTVFTGLDTALPWWRTLDAVRGDVLCNIAFNTGVHGLLGFHKMLAACQASDWVTAGAEIIDSTIASGRAHRLATQMQTGVVQ